MRVSTATIQTLGTLGCNVNFITSDLTIWLTDTHADNASRALVQLIVGPFLNAVSFVNCDLTKIYKNTKRKFKV